MIQTQTKLKIIDNSGAKVSQCIKVLGGYRKKTAKVGDTIVVSIKKVKTGNSNTKSKIRKGHVTKALVLQTKKAIHRKDGSSLRFKDNSALILNQQGQPSGTRVLGVIPKEIKQYKQARVASLAPGIL